MDFTIEKDISDMNEAVVDDFHETKMYEVEQTFDTGKYESEYEMDLNVTVDMDMFSENEEYDDIEMDNPDSKESMENVAKMEENGTAESEELPEPNDESMDTEFLENAAKMDEQDTAKVEVFPESNDVLKHEMVMEVMKNVAKVEEHGTAEVGGLPESDDVLEQEMAVDGQLDIKYNQKKITDCWGVTLRNRMMLPTPMKSDLELKSKKTRSLNITAKKIISNDKKKKLGRSGNWSERSACAARPAL